MLVITVLVVLGTQPVASGAVTNGASDGSGHPQVGALVAEFDGVKGWICSGALVSPTVFVTAAHCTDALQSAGVGDHDVWVTFDPAFSTSGTFWRGTMHTDPLYSQRNADPHDLAVIVLDTAPGITTATLPPAGWADTQMAMGHLRGQSFTVVGYGASAYVVGAGRPGFVYEGARRVATEMFSALNRAWLRMSQNPARGNGGGCYGDSGGPNFIGTTLVVASLTITGDSVCRATNTTYRLDTPGARAFLAQYMTLP